MALRGRSPCGAQLLRDEHEALQLAYNSLERNFSTLERDHQDLIKRWMALKSRDADKLNAENERMLRSVFFPSYRRNGCLTAHNCSFTPPLVAAIKKAGTAFFITLQGALLTQVH